jgi:hypothetical protein
MKEVTGSIETKGLHLSPSDRIHPVNPVHPVYVCLVAAAAVEKHPDRSAIGVPEIFSSVLSRPL